MKRRTLFKAAAAAGLSAVASTAPFKAIKQFIDGAAVPSLGDGYAIQIVDENGWPIVGLPAMPVKILETFPGKAWEVTYFVDATFEILKPVTVGGAVLFASGTPVVLAPFMFKRYMLPDDSLTITKMPFVKVDETLRKHDATISYLLLNQKRAKYLASCLAEGDKPPPFVKTETVHANA